MSDTNSNGYPQTYVTGSGSNDQGNHYCNRVDSAGNTGYHYSNTNGSYYYQNTNGSTYYNTGAGNAQYTSPNGYTYNSSSK